MTKKEMEQKIADLENQVNEIQEQFEYRLLRLEADLDDREPLRFDTEEELDQYLREIIRISSSSDLKR